VERNIVPEKLDREKASKMLGAGYAVWRMFGIHPLEDAVPPVESDIFDASEFERSSQARRERRKRNAA
jgi:hypothetical protein